MIQAKPRTAITLPRFLVQTRFWTSALLLLVAGCADRVSGPVVEAGTEPAPVAPAPVAPAPVANVRLDPAAGKHWQCSNDIEVACADGACKATSGEGFTPMSVSVDDSGAMSVCAYSGCWEGTGEVIARERFLILIGHDLEFSTSRGLESGTEDIVVAIDRDDNVATLKAGSFVHPLLCKQL